MMMQANDFAIHRVECTGLKSICQYENLEVLEKVTLVALQFLRWRQVRSSAIIEFLVHSQF